MKTPKKIPSALVLLLLVAALPAAAQIKAGERCDTEFLGKVAGAFKAGGIVNDADRIGTKVVEGVTIPVLKLNEAKTCDAATWRYLVSGTPPVWRNADAGKKWEAGNAGPGAEVLLAADSFFKAFDPKALKVLAAADVVIEAGVQLGIVAVADTTKPLSELLPGASGGPFGSLKPKAVTLVDAGKKSAVVAPKDIGAVWRQLLDERGASRSGGSSVIDFRMAILALNAELGRPAGAAFRTGLPAGYVTAVAKDEVAMDDGKYDKALADLIGAGATPALDAAAARKGSALEPADLGLRNLIAVRADQVEKIVSAAKARLGSKTITGIEVAARHAVEAKGAKPLAGAALQALARDPKYIELDARYDGSLKGKGAEDPTTKAIGRALADMKDAALSTRIEDGFVVYTQNEQKKVLNVLPPGVAGAAAIEDVADLIAGLIVDRATASGAFKILNAVVIGNTLEPGLKLDTGIKGPEVAVSKEVPQAIAKINADGAGCKDPKDIYRNNFERYATRKQAAAAKIASGNARSRSEIDALETKQTNDSAIECKSRKDAAAALKDDSFTAKVDGDATRAAALAVADAWCKDELDGIAKRAKAAQDALAEKTAKDGERDPYKGFTQANAELKAAFAVAVTGSVSELRKDYTNPGSHRFKVLMRAAVLNPESVGPLVRRNKLWFMTHWPEGEELAGSDQKGDERKKALAASLSKCEADLGLSRIDKDSKVSYGNPVKPDTVAKKCGIDDALLKWIVAQKPKAPEKPKAVEEP